MPDKRLTLNRAELCHELGVCEETLRRILPQLERQGFPPRVPGFNRWSRAAVEDWLLHAGGYRPRGEAAATADEGPIASLAGLLEARYAS